MLRRFGLPSHVVEVVRNIYSLRRFRVKDGVARSELRSQDSGISQGCPLSPFLFVLLMTVIIQDSVESLSSEDKQKYKKGTLATLLYADDTLLVGETGPGLQRLLDAIAATGRSYRMELHWNKLQLLQNGASLL